MGKFDDIVSGIEFDEPSELVFKNPMSLTIEEVIEYNTLLEKAINGDDTDFLTFLWTKMLADDASRKLVLKMTQPQFLNSFQHAMEDFGFTR